MDKTTEIIEKLQEAILKAKDHHETMMSVESYFTFIRAAKERGVI